MSLVIVLGVQFINWRTISVIWRTIVAIWRTLEK